MDSHGIVLKYCFWRTCFRFLAGAASRFAHLAASAVHRTVHTLDISADSAASATAHTRPQSLRK